ncbi:MAG: SCO family protein, partial [Pseudomonadota bacterium]
MLRLYASAAAVAITAVVAGTYAYTQLSSPAGCSSSTLAGAEIGGPFTLVSETGATVTDADVIQQPTLIYFGFTFCPDVCPLDTARMAVVTDIV